MPSPVIAVDQQNDIAVLHLRGSKGRFLGLQLGATLNYAEEITVAGFPAPTVPGREPRVTGGRVNARSGVRDDPRIVHISAPVEPGSSGGPLVSNPIKSQLNEADVHHFRLIASYE